MSELIVLEQLTPATVFKERGGDPVIEKIKQEVLSVNRDISTEEGRKNVASLAYRVARSKTLLDEMGKAFASDLKKQTKSIDAERARIWDALEALQKEVRQPLTEFEDAEKTRIHSHETMLFNIENANVFDGFTPTSSDVQERLKAISSHMQRDWQEFGKRATEMSDRMTAHLQKLLAEKQKQESEQLELERLRKAEAEGQQRERDEKLKSEAAEKARKEAEEKAATEARAAAEKAETDRRAIEQQKIDAEERERKAIEAKKAAEEKAVADAKTAQERAEREKQDAIRQERERAEAQTRAETEAAAEREADIKHRAKINNSALAALVSLGLSEHDAKIAVEGIAKRQSQMSPFPTEVSMVKIIQCEQNTPEWHSARLGRVTSSNMEKIISPTGQKSSQADKYMNQLIAEKITGEPAEPFKGNFHTDRGKEWEQEAANYYAMMAEVELTRIGFCTTDDDLVGCSPDYFIGDDDMLEIKTGLPHVLIEYYLSEKLEQEHRPQTQSGLFVTGRKRAITMLYNPLMKPIIVVAQRNNPYIISMQTMLGAFHEKMAERIGLLRAKGYMEAA